MKKCKACNKDLPKTLEYFYKAYYSNDKLIFQSKCKECSRKRIKPIVKEGYKLCIKCKQELPKTKEYFYTKQIIYFQSVCISCKKAKKL